LPQDYRTLRRQNLGDQSGRGLRRNFLVCDEGGGRVNRKYSIVLAEDCRADVYLVRRALAQSGIDYDLHIVEDGGAVLSLLGRIGEEVPRPDILLMDLNLPKVDGTELIRLFKQNPDCEQVPVIVVTSSDSPKDRARTAQLGISAYFRKPSDLSEFMQLGDLVRNVLTKSDGQAG
jgi:CheY-like chemotaxis protein